MSMVTLPGLRDMIDGISRERNLPKLSVQAALREALLKGYERYRRTQRMDSANFDEDYFSNFEVELDTEEEGFRVLAAKTIVEEVENPDHQIALQEVQEVAAEAQPGDTVVLDVHAGAGRIWPDGGDPNQAGAGPEAARSAAQAGARRIPRPGRNGCCKPACCGSSVSL